MTTEANDLVQKDNIAGVITRLFVATDERDWEGVRACLADPVVLDMTSMGGGEPARMTPAQVAQGWEEGLRPIQALHHQIGNLTVGLDGGRASASCYGTAHHYRNTKLGRNTRVFVGTYDVELRQDDGAWRITLFRFNLKFVDGNRDLEKEPA